MDTTHKGLRKMAHQYELKKAICADDNDFSIENIETKFNDSKEDLRRSVHHLKLKEKLEISFKVLDELEKEYRDFHKQNVDIVDSHEDLIYDEFLKYETVFAGLMELQDPEKKPEYEERNRLETVKKAKWILKTKQEEERKREEDEERRQEELDAQAAKEG